MKRLKKILLIVVGAMVLVAAAGGIWIYSSPMPLVLALRYLWGGDAQILYPQGYDPETDGIQVVRDLEYPSKDGRNAYDLYLPEEASDPLPVVVWVHGGGFVAGSRSGVENWGRMLAGEGYAVAAVDYQWGPEITYPGQVRQVEECLAHLKEQTQYPLDMGQVILAGDSAGAHIAAQCVLLASSPTFAQEVELSSALELGDIQAALLFCGPYDAKELLDVKDPKLGFFTTRIGWSMFGKKNFQDMPLLAATTVGAYVNPDFPPSFVTDGNSGSFESQGKELVKILKENQVPCEELFFGPEEGTITHEYQADLSSEQGYLCWERVREFLRNIKK